ncbi:MAG: RNA methyltransferase [Candidatus Pacebacteria bacterium]|nr:RNA methyltransferase [Candidatus Paceibacterota bacterium]
MLSKQEQKIIRQAASRHGRRKTGLSLSEGLRCCRELLRHRPTSIERVVATPQFAENAVGHRFLTQCGRHGLEPAIVDAKTLSRLAATENPQGVICLFTPADPQKPSSAPRDPFVLVLDQLREPGNVGTILRTAWAAGLHELWITTGTVDVYAPKTIRAGMGAQFALDIRRVDDLKDAREHLQNRDFRRLWVSSPRDGLSCYAPEFDLTASGLVIGNEAFGSDLAGPGITPVTIPMPGDAESLNAAQAATILLFEGVRRGVLGQKKTTSFTRRA